MKTIVLIIFFVFPIVGYCQKDFRPGYIVNATGDTVKGYVQYMASKKINRKCNFRSGKKGATTQYAPEDINAFGYDDDKAFTVKMLSLDSTPARKMFIEKLVEGKADLYRSGKVFLIEKEDLYVLQNAVKNVYDENVLYEQKKKEYAGILNMLFLDCPGLSQKVMKSSLNEKSLVSMTTEYNECSKEPYLVHKKNKAFIQKNYYLITGVTSTEMSFSNDLYPFVAKKRTEVQDISPAFGVGFEFAHPRSVENIMATVELLFSRQGFADAYSLETEFTTINESVKMDLIRLRVPIGLKFQFSSASFSPYIRAGYVMNLYMNGKIDVRQEKNYKNSDFQTINGDDGKIEGFKGGQLWASAGIQKKFGKLRGYMEFRIETIGGRSIPGVHIKGTTTAFIDGKTLETMSVNGFVGLMF